MTIARTRNARKKLFRAALALEGKTLEAWSAERGITSNHVYQVLTGRRESARLTQVIDEYADRWLAGRAVSAA